MKIRQLLREMVRKESTRYMSERLPRNKKIVPILIREQVAEDSKSLLFQILNNSKYVQEFNYVWSPNLIVGADPIFVDFSEKDFFDVNKSVFEIIGDSWPKGKENYEQWKHLYYGLVMGYKIKDKKSNFNILVQISRYDKSILGKLSDKEFDFYINPQYIGNLDSKKIYINDKILNVIGSDEPNSKQSSNDFTKLGKKLQKSVKTVQDCKLLFRYLDAVL